MKLTFHSSTTVLKINPVLYKHSTLDGKKSQLLDPNTLSDDGTTALTAFAPSDDGKLLAYGLSYHGSDWQELFVKNVEAGQDYDEVLKWSKFTRIAWLPDSSGVLL